jgi:retron-type reverse transcriptase
MDENDWFARWQREREERQRAREQRRQERKKQDRAAFGEELWGISAQHRDAKLDAAKLGQLGLPVLHNEGELADWLGISLTRLRWFTHDRPAETTWHYTRYVIPKRSGGERVILAPKRELKALQRKVLDGVVARVPTAWAAHGFVRGCSVMTNAAPHIGKQVVLKLDLKDFFPSITFPRVRGLFIALGYPFSVASTLALLSTEYDRESFDRNGTRYYISIGPRHLVQGAPTSPGLANLVAWRLDRRLSGLAAGYGFTYTRYADDLTFSGDQSEAAAQILSTARRIIGDEHFVLNTAKTRIARPHTRQIVTGLVVNDALATPRPLRRRLRAILHNASKDGLEAQNRAGHQNFRAYLLGMIAFVHAANPGHGAALRASLERIGSGPAAPGDEGAG